ncbi:MAG TPA: RNA polymerase sigma factor [Planctomycetaceae bacterium]|nr:RNA polymerase sigma factor [Planctomycetaceae bacterium]
MSWTSDDAARNELAEWAEAHGAAVRGFLWAITGSPHDADDLCQQVFIRAWKARGRYREEGRARAYLLRIADRLARDWQRRRSERTLSEDQWVLLEPSENGELPQEKAMRLEAGERLTEAMNRLSAAQRRVLLLKYYGDMTFDEISRVTEMPMGTVLSHAHRGLKRLGKIMAEESGSA